MAVDWKLGDDAACAPADHPIARELRQFTHHDNVFAAAHRLDS